MNVAEIQNINEFMVRTRAFTDCITKFIADSPETHPLVVLGALLTLSGRTCAALGLSSADSVQGFVMALADAHKLFNTGPEGTVQ